MNKTVKISMIVGGALISIAGAIYGIKKYKVYRLKHYTEGFLGQEEKTGNLGFKDDKFEQMMKDVGWKRGQSWCAYFVKVIWINKFEKKYPELSKLLSGSTQETWKNFKNDNSGKFTVSKTPHIGDIAIWQYVSKPTQGHTGIVVSIAGDRFETIEGNTNDKGGREGYIVAKRQRQYSFNATKGLKLLGFIHINKY